MNDHSCDLSENKSPLETNQLNKSSNSASDSQKSKKSEEEIYEEEFLRDLCKVNSEQVVAI